MDVHFIGFLLGVFIAGLSAVALWMILGLVVSVIRTHKKKDGGIMIVVYAIETVVPLSVVIALGWLASRISYSQTTFWLAVTAIVLLNTFFLFRNVGLMWKMLKTELAVGKISDSQAG